MLQPVPSDPCSSPHCFRPHCSGNGSADVSSSRCDIGLGVSAGEARSAGSSVSIEPRAADGRAAWLLGLRFNSTPSDGQARFSELSLKLLVGKSDTFRSWLLNVRMYNRGN